MPAKAAAIAPGPSKTHDRPNIGKGGTALTQIMKASGFGAAARRVMILAKPQQAAAAISDPHCREEMGIVGDYAAEIFARGEHRKRESESMSGAEFLRLSAVTTYEERLRRIEDRLGLPHD